MNETVETRNQQNAKRIILNTSLNGSTLVNDTSSQKCKLDNRSTVNVLSTFVEASDVLYSFSEPYRSK